MIINILHFQRMLLDEVAPRLHLLAHEDAEHLIRLQGVFQVDLHEHALGGVEGGFPEFFAVHFAEALEAGDAHAAFAEVADLGDEVAEMGQDLALVAVDESEARQRLAAGDARRLGQAGAVEAELAQALQAAVDAANLVPFLHGKGLGVAVRVAVGLGRGGFVRDDQLARATAPGACLAGRASSARYSCPRRSSHSERASSA